MEKLFTLEEQQRKFLLAQQSFKDGDYHIAEPLFRLVIESAFQHEDYDMYVSAMVWLERILINTSRMSEVYPYIILVNPLIEKYGYEEIKERHELSCIIFNAYNRIGQPQEAYKKLLQEVSQKQYTDLTCAVANNLMYHFVDTGEYQEGLRLYYQMRPLYEKNNSISRMARYMFWIYSFELLYLNKDYEECQRILIWLKERDIIVDSFYFMYPICQALLEMRMGSIDQALIYFDDGLAQTVDLMSIKFELNLVIDVLKENERYKDVIKYQSILIDLLNEHYDFENSSERTTIIQNFSRQFYESQLYVDQLTKVQNRNFYEDLLKKQQQVKNYTLFVLDIDRFKLINGTYGHAVGDEAIKFVADRLKSWNPKHDISIVRYGGDEFIGLIPYGYEVVEEDIKELHEKLMQTPFKVADIETFSLSVSIGVAYTAGRYQLIDQLFRVADAAIYEAKVRRGQVVVKEIK